MDDASHHSAPHDPRGLGAGHGIDEIGDEEDALRKTRKRIVRIALIVAVVMFILWSFTACGC